MACIVILSLLFNFDKQKINFRPIKNKKIFDEHSPTNNCEVSPSTKSLHIMLE